MHQLKLLLLLALLVFECRAMTTRNFTVDFAHNTFLKDGKPFSYISGCMHYFRVPRYYWRDRLVKMKASGLDAVQTYIPWNFHWLDMSYNFAGQRDITAFLQMIQDEGLLAIIRGFPYSCAEWDMGGLPSWLLESKYNTPDPMVLRSSDPKFVAAVESWLDVILPILKPFLYNNGGPIIMVQVENEYGSYYAQDAAYLKTLAYDIDLRLDKNVVLFTTDGNGVNYLKHGHIDDVFQTVDFGPGTDVNASFTLLRKYQTNGPLVNSEFYTGWLDHWGEDHHRTSSEAICKTFEEMLAFNASVNFYMFTGGTNFGYWSGSNGPISQITTSYDYDSPISESGDTTEKYFKIRDVISKYKKISPMPVPANISTISYGTVELINRGTFWDHLPTLCPNGPIVATSPLSFEDLNIFGGYVLYRTKVPPVFKEDALASHLLGLVVENSVRDTAKVFINQVYLGDLNRGSHIMELGFYKEGDIIDLLVASKGRVCYGTGINDSKGISGQVKLIVGITGMVWLTEWEIYPLTLENLDSGFDVPSDPKIEATRFTPSIFSATIFTSMVADTFLDFSGGNWTSGYVLANGFNLGKFEPQQGPQKTLYLPTKSILQDGKTLRIQVFETSPSSVCFEKGHSCTIKLVDKPNLG